MKYTDKQVFEIGLPGARDAGSADNMGFKALNLARMAHIGLKVPEAFVLGTALCRDFLKHPAKSRTALHDLLVEMLRRLETASRLAFGGVRKPLLVSVRSGAPVSMPGMMDTLLNIGLCDATLHGLMRLTGNPRLAWDSYRRLVQQFAEVVHGADAAPFRDVLDAAVREAGVDDARELDFRQLAGLTREFLAIHRDATGQPFPQDPMEQLEAAIAAVFASWNGERATAYRRLNGLPDNLGTAVTVQRMVFGNAGGTSGAGVAFTRNPAYGGNRLYADFLFNSQGEDVVSGRVMANDAPRLQALLPEVWARLESLRGSLEAEFRDAQEFEFTVQDGELFLLQTRSAKRTPWAALAIAVDQEKEGLIAPDEALARLEGIDLERLERRRLAPGEEQAALGRGVSAGIGLAGGPIALDADAAQRFAAEGRPALLVREDTLTADIAGLAACAGLLTVRGSRTAHAAVVARQMGKPCLVGCAGLAIDAAARSVALGGRSLREGDVLWIDAEGGGVYEREPAVAVERPAAALAAVARWRGTGGAREAVAQDAPRAGLAAAAQ
ncbi:MAG: PEP/pyruvate-binding domain-containing protein [Denitratisoma sp.]|nr:PEP/pyruvate-binding domain-containing protein [Denitratisoma sp.]